VDASLQRAQLTQAVATAVALLEVGEERRGRHDAVLVGLEHGHHLGVPDLVEWVGPRAPWPSRLRIASSTAGLAEGRGAAPSLSA